MKNMLYCCECELTPLCVVKGGHDVVYMILEDCYGVYSWLLFDEYCVLAIATGFCAANSFDVGAKR